MCARVCILVCNSVCFSVVNAPNNDKGQRGRIRVLCSGATKSIFRVPFRRMTIDEVGFEALDEAAVAGANGAAWGVPDFGTSLPSPVDIHCLEVSEPFDHFGSCLSDPKVAKSEPVCAELPGSPNPSSLCSIPINAVQESNSSSLDEHPSNFEGTADSAACDKFSVISAHANGDTETQSTIRTSPITRRRTQSAKKLSKIQEELEYGSFSQSDLKGTTAARSRKMTEEERRIMLHKRRLRNRASAARSREKRCRTITDLAKEVEDLLNKTGQLSSQCTALKKDVQRLSTQNRNLQKENARLRNVRSVRV